MRVGEDLEKRRKKPNMQKDGGEAMRVGGRRRWRDGVIESRKQEGGEQGLDQAVKTRPRLL